MAEDQNPPDWSLLPGNPQGFFELVDGFDRKDLKRSYNRLLRRFKPERFPDEFQRIRAAFERLDNQLRYGSRLSHAVAEKFDYKWKTDESAPEVEQVLSGASASPKRKTQRPVPLRDRILQEPLEKIYKELSQKPEKLPYDYFVLAVMSDVVHRKDGLQFLRWILQGVSKHPGDRGLLPLLYEYLRGPVPERAIPQILEAVSKAVPNDYFYALTEKLWHELLETAPFGTFQVTLETCTANLNNLQIDGRLVFTIYLLKVAIWHADLEWTEQMTSFLEENFERIPGHLEFDVDLIDFLKKYCSRRAEHRGGHPLRRKIDQAIQDYFTKDQSLGDQSVVECQIAIAQDPAGLLDAFPFEMDDQHEDIYTLWSFVSSDVAERHVEEAEPANVSAWRDRGRALYERIERKVNSSLVGRRWSTLFLLYAIGIGAFYLAVTIFLFVLTLTFFIDVENDGAAILGVVFGVIVSLGISFWSQRRFFSPRWQSYADKQATLCYAKYGRPELVEFLQRSRFSYQELKELLGNCEITNLKLAQGVYDRYHIDYGLGVYSLAIIFQS